jgi:hypothetical protein
MAPTASSTSLNACALAGLVEVPRTATRVSLATISFRSSSYFPLSCGARVDKPVMFPPGRARLAMNTTTRRIDDTTAVFVAHIILAVFVTDTEAEKSVIYGRRKTRFIKEKKANLHARLN